MTKLTNPLDSFLRGVLFSALILGLAVPALAHPRRYRHVHRRGRVHFHVVVGAPRVVAVPIVLDGRPAGAIDFHVEPSDTSVLVDGTYRGTVDQYDGHPEKLVLAAGVHRVTLKTPDGEEWSEKVRIRAGHEIELKVELEE